MKMDMGKTMKIIIATFDGNNNRKLRTDMNEETLPDNILPETVVRRAADKRIFDMYMHLGISFDAAKSYFRKYPTYVINTVYKKGLNTFRLTRITDEMVDDLKCRMTPELMCCFLDECPYNEEMVRWLVNHNIPELLKAQIPVN